MSSSRAAFRLNRSELLSVLVVTMLFVAGALSFLSGRSAVAQDDENEYVNPTYGYQIAWEPDVWEVVEDGPGDLALTSDLVEISLQSGQFYAGDATACRDDLVDRLPDDDTVLASEPYEGDGEQSGEVDGRAYSTLRVELGETDGEDARTLVERIDCRTLVAGEAVLAITWLTPIDVVEDAVEAADTLLDALVIPSFQGPGADTEGLDDDSYTDLEFGFTMTWDASDWTSFVPVDAIFGLNSTTSLISFDLPDDFGGDNARCVEETLDDLGSSPGIVDVRPIEVDGEDVAGLDDAGWSFAAIDANYGGAERFVEVRCAAIPNSEVTLRAVHSGPIGSYEGQAELAAPIFGNLTVVGGDDGAAADATPATPVAPAETEPAVTPAADQGTPVPDEPAATPVPDGPVGTPLPDGQAGTPGSSNATPTADGMDVFTSEEGGWSLAYNGSFWQPLDPALFATVDLAIGGGSFVVTISTIATDGREVPEILDRLNAPELAAAAGNSGDIDRLDDPPIPSDEAAGVAYGYRTPGGADAVLGIVVIPVSGDVAVVVRIYTSTDGLTNDSDALQTLLDGFLVITEGR